MDMMVMVVVVMMPASEVNGEKKEEREREKAGEVSNRQIIQAFQLVFHKASSPPPPSLSLSLFTQPHIT